MFRNNFGHNNNNNQQPAVFLSTQDQIRRANSAGSTASSASTSNSALNANSTSNMMMSGGGGLMMMAPTPASTGMGGSTTTQHLASSSSSAAATVPPPMPPSCIGGENGLYAGGVSASSSSCLYSGGYHHHQQQQHQPQYPPAYNLQEQQGYSHPYHHVPFHQPSTFHAYGAPTHHGSSTTATSSSAPATTTTGAGGQKVILSHKAVIPMGALSNTTTFPAATTTGSLRAGAVAPPPAVMNSGSHSWTLDRRASLESAELSSVHSSTADPSSSANKEEDDACNAVDLNETYSRGAGCCWTVTASTTTGGMNNSAPATTKTSPIQMAAVPIQTESLWASASSAPQSMLTTPNLSFRLDNTKEAKPILPPPAAPVLRPKKVTRAKPLLDLVSSSSAPTAAEFSTLPPPPPQDGFQLPPSLATTTLKDEAASRSCSPDPLTAPTSVIQTPKKMVPGAVDVSDLESDFFTASRKVLPASTWGESEQQQKTAAPTTVASLFSTPKKQQQEEQQPAAVEESPAPEQETLFKPHRYRGPRHCRACRFHSKSLNSNCVVTRDLNKKYKVSLFCKVCNVQFEDCVDDSMWQKKWDEHCKTESHRRCALSSGPELRSREGKASSVAATTTTTTASTGPTASGNGGMAVPAPRSQQQQSTTTTITQVPSTPDRKTQAQEPTTVPRRHSDRPLPPVPASASTTTNSPVKFGIIGRSVAEVESDLLSINQKVASWAAAFSSNATTTTHEDEQEEVVVYSSPFSF